MGFPALKKLDDTGLPTFELSVIQIGSDEFSEDLRRDRAGVQHQRYGVTVASRTWKQARVWNLNINVASKAFIASLREFFEVGSFYLYPDIDNTAVKYNVYWENDSFDPVYVSPGKYSLKATFKETTIGAGTPTHIGGSVDQVINGDLTVNGDLSVTGVFDVNALPTVRSNGDIYINYDGPDQDSSLYFFNNGSTEHKYLKWVDGYNFELNYDLEILGSLDVEGVTASGSISTGGNFSSVGTIGSGGNLTSSGYTYSHKNLYVNYSNYVSQGRVYFHDGTSVNGAFLEYNTTNSRFYLNDELSVSGNINGTEIFESGISLESIYSPISHQHPASQITAGTFASGDFGFNGIVEATHFTTQGNVDADQISGVDGIFLSLSLGGTSLTSLFAPISHSQNASTIESGTFATGDFVFPGTVTAGNFSTQGNINGDAITGVEGFFQSVYEGGISLSSKYAPIGHTSNTSNPHSVDEADILPTQVGNSGKVLSTNGTITSWVDADSGGAHTHAATDITPGTFPSGDYAFNNGILYSRCSSSDTPLRVHSDGSSVCAIALNDTAGVNYFVSNAGASGHFHWTLNGTNRMQLEANGDLQIDGTISVGGRVEVYESASAVETVAIDFHNSTFDSLPAYGIGMGPTSSEGFLVHQAGTSNSASFGHRFKVAGNNILEVQGNSSTTGRVGINDQNPSYELDVNGTIAGNNDLRISDQVGIGNGGILSSGSLVNVDAVNYFTDITSNTTNYQKAMTIECNGTDVNAGITDSGYRVGLAIESYLTTSEFEGTLNSEYALWARVGTHGDGPTGNINNAMAVYADTMVGANSTIGNLYGIYQPDSYASNETMNYFAGHTKIGGSIPTSMNFALDVDGTVRATSVSATTYSGITHAKGMTIPTPESSDDMTMWITDRALTVGKTNVVVRGSSPSVPWSIKFATDRSAAGTTMNSGTATSTASGHSDTTMNDATIPAGYWIWLELGTITGTVDEFHITLKYTED